MYLFVYLLKEDVQTAVHVKVQDITKTTDKASSTRPVWDEDFQL